VALQNKKLSWCWQIRTAHLEVSQGPTYWVAGMWQPATQPAVASRLQRYATRRAGNEMQKQNRGSAENMIVKNGGYV